MDYKIIFYWLTVADNARGFFLAFAILFTIICFISTLIFIFARQDLEGNLSADKESAAERAKKWMWYGYPFMMLFIALNIFTPSKRDSLLILAGGETLNFLTTDESARQIPKELSSFVLTELKNMAEDAKVEMNIKSTKQKVFDRAKEMTSEELIQELKVNEEFRSILMENR